MPPRASAKTSSTRGQLSRSISPSPSRSSDDSKQPVRRSNRDRRLSNEGAHAIVSEFDGRMIDSNGDDSVPGDVSRGATSTTIPTAPNTVGPSHQHISSSSLSSSRPTLPAASALVSPAQIQNVLNNLALPRHSTSTSTSTPRPRPHTVATSASSSITSVPDLPQPDQKVGVQSRHRSPSSSSSDDTDCEYEKDDDKGSLRWGRVFVPADRRVGIPAYEQLQSTYRTHRAEVAALPLKEPRNRYEVETLSLIADAALEGRNDVVYEIAVRRIWGVRHADTTGSWSLASSMELVRTEGYGSSALFHHFVKQANKLEAQLKKTSTSSPSKHKHRNKGRKQGSGNKPTRHKGSDNLN